MTKFNFVPIEKDVFVAPECPHCGKEYGDYPALSRRDNKTNICPECGREEAFVDRYDLEREEQPRDEEI